MDVWHEQDAWWEAVARVIFQAQTLESAPQQVEQSLALAGIEPPVHVLDLPCGVGRHAIEFARLGCTVTAVDRTAAYLAQARARAEELGLPVEFVQDDMRTFRRPEAFDLIVNLFTSFGYFKDPAEDRRVLENFYVSLRPGGTLVIDVAGKEVLARKFIPRDWHELPDGTLILEERTVTEDWTWFENRWILIKEGQRREYPFSHRIYGASDLKSLLGEVGFSTVRVYGDLGGSPYDHAAQRLVVTARREAA